MNNTKYSEKRVLLLGEGIHQHTLYGRIENNNQFSENDIILDEDGVLVTKNQMGPKANITACLLPRDAGSWAGKWSSTRSADMSLVCGISPTKFFAISSLV